MSLKSEPDVSKCGYDHCSFPECHHECNYVPEGPPDWEDIHGTPEGYNDL